MTSYGRLRRLAHYRLLIESLERKKGRQYPNWKITREIKGSRPDLCTDLDSKVVKEIRAFPFDSYCEQVKARSDYIYDVIFNQPVWLSKSQ